MRQLRLQWIEGQPGLFRSEETGQILNMRDFSLFESSVRFEGKKFGFVVEPRASYILVGCHFTCAKWPSVAEMQQRVKISVPGTGTLGGPVISAITLASVLTIPGDHKQRDKTFEEFGRCVHMMTEQNLEVELTERPVEGCGLRIHLYGLKRAWRS